MNASARAPAPRHRHIVPLGRLAFGLVVASALLAGVVGYALAIAFGAAEPWTAGLAAALGMLATAAPLGLVLVGLARTGERAPSGPAEAAAAPPLPALSRGAFLELADREWARARRYGSGAALLLVDVDRFARVVEEVGAAAGDALLREIVHDISPTLRGADALALFGEGQLAVFLAQADATGALDVAERIRERVEALEVPHAPRRLRVTASVGVAHLRPAHLHLQALLDDAGDAVLAARQAGGNCVRAAPVELGRLASSGPSRNGQRLRKP